MKTCRVVLLIVLATGAGAAAEEKSWNGEFVLYTKWAKDIEFGDRVDGKQVYFPFSGQWPLRVRDDREGWLRIHDGNREGWAHKVNFVLVRDARDYFHRRVQANPKDTFALYMRGVAWLQKGEPDNAIADFNECIRLDPTNHAAFNSRGIAWSRRKEYDKAIKDHDEAIRLDPKNAIAFNSRGNAWGDRAEYDRAIRDYDEAIRLDPKYATAFHNRGITWSQKKEYDRAIRDQDEAIRLDPKYADAFYDKACCYALQGKLDLAISNLQESLELGYRDFEHLKTDSDLDSLRSDDRYKKLIEKYAK
jgi:tetratricopeptide (TPR) repeat protein